MFAAIFKARCPSCHLGSIYKGVFTMRKRCPKCGYDYYPEPGFYMGAIMLSFMITGMLTVPPMVIMKLLNVDMKVLVIFPFIEFLFVGTFLMFYSRVFWLYLEFRTTGRLDGDKNK